jgi:hypothetical protein
MVIYDADIAVKPRQPWRKKFLALAAFLAALDRFISKRGS